MANHQLDQLAGQLRTGARRGRTPTNGFPTALGSRRGVAAVLPPSRVAKQVRVRLMDLKKRMATRGEGTARGPLCPWALSSAVYPPGPPPRRDPDRAVPRRWHPTLHSHAMTTLALDALYGPLWRDAHAATDPQSRIFLATQPVDSAKAWMDLQPCVRQYLGRTAGGCRLRSSATAPAPRSSSCSMMGRVLALHEALIAGRFTWWPRRRDTRVPSPRGAHHWLWNGDPGRAQMAHDWAASPKAALERSDSPWEPRARGGKDLFTVSCNATRYSRA